MRPRIKRSFNIALLNVAFCVLGIVVLELIFGNWLRSNSINRLNIVRSRTIKFDVEGLYEAPSKIATYTRDEHGLRGSFGDPGEIDILTVGGSTTDQRFISDGETWQDVLQERFASAGSDVVVGNAGVDGQSTVGHIKNFEWWFPYVPELRPRYILFYVGLNDFYTNQGRKFDDLLGEGKKSFRDILREKSALYHAMRTIYGLYLARYRFEIAHLAVDFTGLEWTTMPKQDSYTELMQDRLMKYSERLSVLIRKTREIGSTPILVTQPSRRYRVRDGVIEGVAKESVYDGVVTNGVDFYHMMRKMDETTISVCRENHVFCIDLAVEPIWEDADFYDFAHMTPAGARKVGECLFEKLKDKL